MSPKKSGRVKLVKMQFVEASETRESVPPLPSLETEGFRVGASGPIELEVPRSGHPREGPGKWLLFVKRIDVDQVWAKVCVALESGLLGSHAKVSTARPNSNSSNPDKHVICVYTCNAGDESDVMRVRQALRDLGFVGKIAYKTDSATIQGKYENRGNTRISKHFV